MPTLTFVSAGRYKGGIKRVPGGTGSCGAVTQFQLGEPEEPMEILLERASDGHENGRGG
jgi:hypothetical protein